MVQIYVIPKRDDEEMLKISYCNRCIHVYKLNNKDGMDDTLKMVKLKIDPTYNSCKTKWKDLYGNDEKVVHF